VGLPTEGALAELGVGQERGRTFEDVLRELHVEADVLEEWDRVAGAAAARG
jgi:hypothetical protein